MDSEYTKEELRKLVYLYQDSIGKYQTVVRMYLEEMKRTPYLFAEIVNSSKPVMLEIDEKLKRAGEIINDNEK